MAELIWITEILIQYPHVPPNSCLLIAVPLKLSPVHGGLPFSFKLPHFIAIISPGLWLKHVPVHTELFCHYLGCFAAATEFIIHWGKAVIFHNTLRATHEGSTGWGNMTRFIIYWGMAATFYNTLGVKWQDHGLRVHDQIHHSLGKSRAEQIQI